MTFPSSAGDRNDGVGFVRGVGDGERISLPRWDMRVTVRAQDTGSALTVVENTMLPGHPGPVPHRHDRHDETFVILRGRLRFRIGDEFLTAGPGQTVFAGRNLVHGFANPFDEPAEWTLVLTPSGYERYFRALAAAFADTGALPRGDDLTDLMAEYATTPVPVLSDDVEL